MVDIKKEHESKLFHLEKANKTLEERAKILKAMNLDLQKKVQMAERKTDTAVKKSEKYDELLIRFVEVD